MNVITVQQVSSTLCMPHLPDEKNASDHAHQLQRRVTCTVGSNSS
jgi:hypothetical protein